MLGRNYLPFLHPFGSMFALNVGSFSLLAFACCYLHIAQGIDSLGLVLWTASSSKDIFIAVSYATGDNLLEI